MELGALICKPNSPICYKCPIAKNCKSFAKKDFSLSKIKKKNKDKYFLLKVYKKNNRYMLVKNTSYKFLKNLSIFPMEEIKDPKQFKQNLNFKMSNMNMNIKIEYKKKHNFDKNINWINPAKLENYVLPTFTKKIIKFLESQK